MRYVFRFLMALAVFAFAACGGDECADPVADVTGEWKIDATPITDTCGGSFAPYTFFITATQEGNALTSETPEGTMTGTICGDQIRMSLRSTEGGRTATVNMELAVSLDGNSAEGSDTWRWTSGAQSCRGSESLSGTRVVLDATCSPWCTVVAECTAESFSECMRFCHEELLQAQGVSTECADAVRNQNVCLGELSCAEFEAWLDEVPPDAYPCKSADDTVLSVCFEVQP